MGTLSNKYIQTEVDAYFLYNKLAEAKTDEPVANVLQLMIAIEKSIAQAF